MFYKMFRKGKLAFAGNVRLRIYGTLRCGSGKRMKKSNRVFFESATEAEDAGYRPCGHCLREEYKRKKQVGRVERYREISEN